MPDPPYTDILAIAAGKPDPNRSAHDNPRVKQFLDRIGQSEGADYNTLVGGSRIDDLSRHPNKVGLRTKAGPSTAFGKYQIVGSTDRSKLAKYRHLDYSPRSSARSHVSRQVAAPRTRTAFPLRGVSLVSPAFRRN
jgi:muramidase (phage lysozyme)